MRIAHVAPLFESVPPKLYGGTERIISYLTEELVALGHDVTLFASGDSKTSAHLIPIAQQGLRLDHKIADPLALHFFMLEQVAKLADEFDMIHFHIDYLHFGISRRMNYEHVTTLHGRLDVPEIIKVHEEFSEMPLISISNSQRKPMLARNWLATVYHGLPINLYNFNSTPEPYLAFLGRVSPEKRLDRAIQIAEVSGVPLKIAAKVDKADREYFNAKIAPLIKRTNLVEFLGEVNDHEKQDFLGNASALLFPIDWPEPFGIVMIEAMACGTPVIAYPQGSVPEVIREGVSGYMVSNLVDAVKRVHELHRFNRYNCRMEFENRFTSSLMAQNYIKVYRAKLGEYLYQSHVNQLSMMALQ